MADEKKKKKVDYSSAWAEAKKIIWNARYRLALGSILGAVGLLRVGLWDALGWSDYGPYPWRVALTVGLSLVGVVMFGGLAGSMLPFLLKRFGFDPASASAPFVATLVDVTGIIIYFSVASVVLSGVLL